MTKISIKVTKVAFYKGCLVYPNEIIKGYEGDIPTWATLAGGKEQRQDIPNNSKKGLDSIGQNEQVEDKTNVGKEGEAQEGLDSIGQNADEQEGEIVVAGDGGVHVVPEEKTEVQLQEELDALLNEGIEKNIILEDADKKTIAEQVEEMKKLLGKV